MTERTGQDGIASEAPTPDGSTAGSAAVEVADNVDLGRFELRDGGRVIGVAAYALVPGEAADSPERIVFFHTEVRPEYEGQGLGGRLAAHALDSALASGRAVVALCPYIKAYVQRHPEAYAAHVVPATQADVDAADRSVDR